VKAISKFSHFFFGIRSPKFHSIFLTRSYEACCPQINSFRTLDTLLHEFSPKLQQERSCFQSIGNASNRDTSNSEQLPKIIRIGNDSSLNYQFRRDLYQVCRDSFE
jgi:hypothetical protein